MSSFRLRALSFVAVTMGELKVHRVRFFDYMPSAIRAMAFNPRTERLAVAREDGALEVFNFSDHYFQEKVGQPLWTETGRNSKTQLVKNK